MIAKLVVYRCRKCNSENIVKNGHNASGSQQYWCKECGQCGVLEPKRSYTEEQKEHILSAYSERSSMCGIQRTFGVSRPTLAAWLKKRRNQSQTWRDTLACGNCGPLSMCAGTNAGCGRSCVTARAQSWRLSSEIAARPPVASCGRRSHRPTNLSFRKRRMSVLAKAVGRRITWNVAITPWDKLVHTSAEKLRPFQSLTPCTRSSLDSLSFNTTYHLLLDHYQWSYISTTICRLRYKSGIRL